MVRCAAGPPAAGKSRAAPPDRIQEEVTVPSDENDTNGISRRDFASRLGAAAAGVALGGEFFRPTACGRRVVGGRILGANDRVVTASIGIRGQGNSLKRGFAQLKNVEIKTLCDIDANLADSRINDERADGQGADLQADVRSGPAARPRRQGHRRDRHRHPEPLARAGHDLGASGRQARLRRKAGLPHGVGRAKDGRGGRSVQQGRPGRDDEPEPSGGQRRDQVHAGRRHRQGLHGARAVLQAAPVDRQVSRRPDAGRREQVQAQRRRRPASEPTVRRTVPRRRSTTTCGSDRRRSGRSTATASTTTGTGTGITATATPATRGRTSSTSRAGASASTSIR